MTQPLTDVIAEAMLDDPFWSDNAALGTTDHTQKIEHYASVALKAIDQAGYVAVPKEPSDKQIDAMVKAFTNPRDIYAAMLSASKEGITE